VRIETVVTSSGLGFFTASYATPFSCAFALKHVFKCRSEAVRELRKGKLNRKLSRISRTPVKELAKIQKDLEEAGFQVVVHIRVGKSVEKIASLVEEEEVSLILMCAHKKNWIEVFIQGSTPFSIMRSSEKQVMILRIG
jgi:nucleotide-binding universal stress UspA family protein